MGTRSQGERRLPRTIVEGEGMLASLLKSMNANRDEAIRQQNKLCKERAALKKDIRRNLAEISRSANNIRKVGSASAAILVIPLLLIIGSKYQA
ncbi:hypothetical protein ACP70R_022861 [Stipagrostis hirtigluma subsp. patula]